MRLLILHLCDIHFKSDSPNAVLDRVVAMVSAAHNVMPNAEHVVVAITGDVAFSGAPQEYAIAGAFFSHVTQEIHRQCQSVKSVLLAVVPGNHDCNFRSDQSLRHQLLSSKNAVDLSKSSIVHAMAHPLQDFRVFVQQLRIPNATVLNCFDHPTTRMLLGEESIKLTLLNSALCATQSPNPGSLRVPMPEALPESGDGNPIASLFLCHHPPHWLDPADFHLLRSAVVGDQGVLLTGHEHSPSLWISDSKHSIANFVEGGVLQDSANREVSKFYVISLDTGSASIDAKRCGWNGTIFVGEESRSLPWGNSTASQRSIRLSLQAEFAERLDDPGDLITHPRRSPLKLSDVFIMPDLKKRPFVLRSASAASIIRGAEVQATITLEATSLVAGNARTGKTSIAKQLFKSIWQSGQLPLLIDGADLAKSDLKAIRSNLDAQVTKTYRLQNADEYFNRVENKILIVDDFDRCSKNRKFQSDLILYLRSLFSCSILFVNSVPQVEELTREGTLLSGFETTTTYSILPFGHEARANLIEKWVRLGTSPIDDELELDAAVVETERLIESLLREVMPPTAFYILSLLTALTHGQQPSADLGSLGFLYESLIRASLAKAVSKPELLQTFDRFLGELAFGMFSQQAVSISEADFQTRCSEYAQRFLIDFEHRFASRVLQEAHILTIKAGHVHFRYIYIYCFYVAKHLSQRLSTAAGRDQVTRLISRLHSDNASTVLLFLCHCTSDPFVVDSILTYTGSLFESYSEVDIFKDTKFLCESTETASRGQVVLASGDPSENRKAMARAADDSPQGQNREVPDEVASMAFEDETVDHVEQEAAEVKLSKDLSRSVHTLDIVGEILKNHPSAIEGSKKVALVMTCGRLVRRMTKAMLGDMSNNSDRILKALQKAILERGLCKEAAKAKIMSGQLFNRQVEMVFTSIISMYASKVGMPQLGPVFDRVRKEHGDDTNQFMDLALRLENPRVFPETEALAVASKCSHNRFVFRSAQSLVYLHFYLYRTKEFRQRTRVCQRYEIAINDPGIIALRDKL